jgi:hypothetical protein
MLLDSAEDLHPALAAFYALGARRNGWLFHRAFPGHGARDRDGLTRAGLDIPSLEESGCFALDELPVTEPPERWAQPWLPVIDARLRSGFDAVWWSRFPVGVARPEFGLALDYDAAWDAAMRGRRAVSVCVYLVGRDVDEAGGADAEERIGRVHDGLLRITGADATFTRTR